MLHVLTIGFFDPGTVPAAQLVVERPLDSEHLSAIQARLDADGIDVELREFLDARGVLVVPWLGFSSNRALAAAIARAAHETVDALVADVQHGQMVNPDDPTQL